MAGIKLYLGTGAIWDHFYDHFERLQENEDCIAENKDNGMSLYLTANTILPQLVLYHRDKPILLRIMANSDECNQWATYLIMKFVSGIAVEEVEEKPKIIELPMAKPTTENDTVVDEQEEEEGPTEEEEEQAILDKIYQREDELSQAMGDFLAVVLCEDDCTAVKETYGEQFINEVVDDVLQYLSDMHNVSVYRPTLETDPETGCEVLKEFPYGWNNDEDYEDIE